MKPALLTLTLFILGAVSMACTSNNHGPADSDLLDGSVDAPRDQEGDTTTEDVALTEAELDDCVSGDTCIIVPYDHCCGATKRAINVKYKAAYETHPEWQSYHEADCAMIGQCMDDSGINTAVCGPDGFCLFELN